MRLGTEQVVVVALRKMEDNHLSLEVMALLDMYY
jgi:hypothetical protein